VILKRFELRKDLAFLLEQKVIEKNPSDTTPAYFVSPLGLRLVKYFSVHTVVEKQPE
jgi:RPA family protein